LVEQTLAEIRIYPVKSLYGACVDKSHVAAPGLIGDRRWMVVQPDGKFRTLRETPAFTRIFAAVTASGLRLTRRDTGFYLDVPFPDEKAELREVTVWRSTLAARDAGDRAAKFLRDATGQDLRLVHMYDETLRRPNPALCEPTDVVSFADGYPMLLTGRASLDALNGALARPVEMRVFRPNLVIEGAAPWAEDGWRRIRIGKVAFRVVTPCQRCVMTTRDPDTGKVPVRGEPLDTLGRIHGDGEGRPMFGQNLIPDRPGQIAVGDRVEVLEAGPSNLP